MKVIIIQLLLLISIIGYGQGSYIFRYINEYRISNGLSSLIYDTEMEVISSENTYNMITRNSLLHSGTNRLECSSRQFTLAPTQADLDGFNKFLGKYYNVDSYRFDLDSINDLDSYFALYTIYEWHLSPSHRAIILNRGVRYASASANYNLLGYKLNYKEIGGEKILYTNFISHYEMVSITTLNLR